MGESSLCSLFPHLYYLFSSKNCMMSDLLVGSENLVSCSFGFRHNLTNREAMEVVSLLPLVEGCSFRKGRRGAQVWSPNPSRGYTCKSLFSLLLDPSPPTESIFEVVWRTKVPKKVRFFIWQVLFGRVTLLTDLLRGGLHLLSIFVAFSVERRKETLITFFGIVNMLRPCGVFLCKRH